MNGREINWIALIIVVLLFVVVAVMGFLAARWRRTAESEGLHSLDECWRTRLRDMDHVVPAGRRPLHRLHVRCCSGRHVGHGCRQRFFAVPYTIVLYPIIFIIMSRLWSVSHRHGYVTSADFVGGRYGSRWLSLAIAVTGIVATMPYIALQLVGIKAVLTVLGLGRSENVLLTDLPLILAFVVLAAYTYTSGLRAPAMIAVVKDLLIYLAVIVAVIYLPIKFGGWDAIFGAAKTKLDTVNEATGKPSGVFIPSSANYSAYWTLALGSAMALFMYPHSITGVLASKGRNTIRRNAAILPLYSLMLGFLALLGFVAIKAGTKPIDLNGSVNPQLVVPQLFLDHFPAWFAGVALAAIAIGALVPAAIMSIAAANMFTRNVYRDFLRPEVDPKTEAKVSKIVSLVVKVGALIFVIAMDQSAAINMQLLGGIWILQTFPAVVAGLYTRWFDRWALLAGWAVGIAFGTASAYNVINPVTHAHFGGSIAPVPGTGFTVYIAVSAFVLNLLVAVVLTLVLRALKVPQGEDKTRRSDYGADETDPKVAEIERTQRFVEPGGPSPVA
ncbi:sodium:solute symporter [Arthrobacter sp. NPDC058097]|uniref:sodium:solute symporter family protein n=1 Tax=Arthrobacter sp. NPDC058097 TaxID=3346340 RepID=UPI0036DE6F4B